MSGRTGRPACYVGQDNYVARSNERGLNILIKYDKVHEFIFEVKIVSNHCRMRCVDVFGVLNQNVNDRKEVKLWLTR